MTSTALPTTLPGCVLRPWREGDQDELIRQANHREVWRNLTDLFPHLYTRADADFWITLAHSDPRSLHLAIEVDGRIAGGIGAIAGTGLSVATAEFGYWLGPEHWGRGIATAAARAFKDHLIASRRFARLQAPVFAWNLASMRVLEKIGFEREGVLRCAVTKDGELTDSVIYAFVDPKAGRSPTP